MNIYSDKLTHVQVIINCLYSIAQFCTCKDTLAYISGAPPIDDVISYNSLTTIILKWNAVCSPDKSIESVNLVSFLSDFDLVLIASHTLSKKYFV